MYLFLGGYFSNSDRDTYINQNPPTSGVETVSVVGKNIKSWIGKGYGVPNIKLTPAEIFAGNVAALDANFFETNKDYSNKLGGNDKSIVLTLKSTVSQWYVALRNIAIVGLLSVLLYIGIRIVISSSAGDKAKYKQFFADWVVALCLIFFLHYIMSFTMTMAETITDVLAGDTKDEGTIKQVNISITDEGKTFSSNFTGVARIKAQYKGSLEMMGYSIIYLALTLYTVYFAFIYLKRLLMLAFFTMIAPLVALTYPLDKIKDGHAQAFNYWFKEYMFYAILQPLHMLLYTVFVSSALSVAASNMLYAIIALAFIVPAEKIIKQMFGIKGATESNLGGFAGGAIAAQAFNALKKGPNSGNKNASQANNNKVRQVKNPNDPNSMETLAGDAMSLDEQALAAGTAAAMGAGAGVAMAEGNDDVNTVTNVDTLKDNDATDVIAMAAQEASLSNGTGNPDAGEKSEETPTEPLPKTKDMSDAKAERKRLANNFSKAVKKRFVVAGGAKGIAKSALIGAAKGYGRMAGTVALGAIGLGAGIVGGDMGDTLKGMGAGLAAGSVVSKRTEKAIGNTFSNNSAIGRFANDVFYGDDKSQKAQFVQQYMKNQETSARILDKNPDMKLADLRAQQKAEAEMMYDTGIDDYSTIKSAVKLEQQLEAEGVNNSHDMAAVTAKLSQNYDKNTFTDPKKYNAAQQALKLRLEQQMTGGKENLTEDKKKEISARANEEATKTLRRIEAIKHPYK